MFLVGLTGGIAAGKSTVARRFVEAGFRLVDADAVAREVVEPGEPALARLVERFGREILAGDGTLDRAALGRRVFGDPEAQAALGAITHPAILVRMAERIAAAGEGFDGVVVADVPLLVEAGLRDGSAGRAYAAVVVVATRPETQLDRLVRDRGMDPDEARARIAAQAPLEDKLAAATHVIWNEGAPDELLERADEVADELRREAAAAGA